jgi:hypothetical protein
MPACMIAVLLVCMSSLSGCATTPRGYDVADQATVAANAVIARGASALSDDRAVVCVLYWSTVGDTNTRILASVRELKHRGCIQRARAAGLSGSDADVLIGVALAGATGGHPP